MTASVDYELSDLIKESIRKKERDDNINELLIDILEKEVVWQDEEHDALVPFKKTYKKLIDEYCPYTGGN